MTDLYEFGKGNCLEVADFVEKGGVKLVQIEAELVNEIFDVFLANMLRLHHLDLLTGHVVIVDIHRIPERK